MQLDRAGSKWRRRLRRTTSMLVGILATLGVAGLLAEHGFDQPPVPLEWCRAAQIVAVAAFVLDRLGWLLAGPNRLAYAKQHWFDLSLILIALLVSLLAPQLTAATVVKAGAIYVAILQAW